MQIYDLVMSHIDIRTHQKYFFFICPSCKQQKTVSLSVWNRCKKNNIIHLCKDCSKKDLKPARGKKRSNNTSGYIGVNRHDNEARSIYGWESRLMSNGIVSFKVLYKDKEMTDNEVGKHLCAIDRDIYIIENNLHHKRNFTDKQLSKMILDYQFEYTKYKILKDAKHAT